MRNVLMKLKEYLNRVHLNNVKFITKFAEAEFSLNDNDKDAAWELYVELITRIVTQELKLEEGDEEAALKSVYSLFPITREILKRKGRDCIQFSKIAVAVLNQIVRPFTAKWHKKDLAGAFKNQKECMLFREELKNIQKDMRRYTCLLAEIAEVEDLTDINGEFLENQGKTNAPAKK